MNPEEEIHNRTLSILLIEDNPGDARLIEEMLKDASDIGFYIRTAGRLASGIECLKTDRFDIIILDLGLPDSRGLESFRGIYEHGRNIPILVMTGLADETIGMQAVQEGAQDYLLKGTISGKLLIRIIRFAVERKRILDERDALIEQLKDALGKIKTLKGLVPICSYCKKIRNDKGYWEQLEAYVSKHTEAEFTHGICKECAKKVYADLEEFTKANKDQV